MLIVKAYIANESFEMALIQRNPQNRFDKSCCLPLTPFRGNFQVNFHSGLELTEIFTSKKFLLPLLEACCLND